MNSRMHLGGNNVAIVGLGEDRDTARLNSYCGGKGPRVRGEQYGSDGYRGIMITLSQHSPPHPKPTHPVAADIAVSMST